MDQSVWVRNNLAKFPFKIKTYGEISEGIIDYLTGEKIDSSNHTAYLKGFAVDTYFSLLSYTMDYAKERGYTLITLPSIAKKDIDKYFGLPSISVLYHS